MKKLFIPLLLVLLFSFNNIFASTTRYVATSGTIPAAPYNTWATAATSIQVAIDASVDGDIILVGNGTYILSANISITKGITLKSANGYSSTTINGNGVTRCIYIDHASGVIDGFTITNGYNPGGFGGAANIISGGTIQNCFISNSQARDGGGVAIDNSGLVQNCIITGNSANNNSGDGYGGGVRMLYGGITRNCLVYNNSSVNLGGGINIWEAGTIQNCTVVKNTAPYGAGVRCRNASVMENTISYLNNGLNWETAGSSFNFANNCTTPALPSGSGNILADPLFINAGTNNFHLQQSSPAVNAGLNSAWMSGATDLDGNNRLLNTTVDMGAYEFKNVVIAGPVPTASWPTGNTVEYTNPPTLNWYLGTDATGYTFEIQCVAASAPWPLDYEYATSSSLSYTIPNGLTNGVQYAWRVRSTNGVTKSNWSSTALFTVAGGTNNGPVVPIASWPVGNPTQYLNPPTLNWYLGTSVTGLTYEIQCVPASAPWPADNDYTTSSNLSYTIAAGLTNGVQYAWRVRSTNGITKSGWSTYALFTMVGSSSTGPVIPIASWPVGNPTVYTNPPTLNWYLGSSVTGLSYEIQCVAASAPWPADDVYFTSSNLSYTIASGLTSGVQYAWRVRSNNGVTKSGWSTYALFTMVGNSNNGPVSPVLSWPVGNPTVYTNPPTLNWYLGSSVTGLSYEIQCVAASAPWPADDVYFSSSNLSYTIASGLTSGVQYAWRVRSNNGVTKSGWSAYALFTMASNNSGLLTAPIASWPVGNPTVYTNPPTLNWYLGTSVTGLTYEIQCVAAAAPWPADNVYVTSPNLSYTITGGLTSGVQYAWRVRSNNGVTKSGWSTYALFTMASNNSLVQPITGSPSNSVTINTRSAELFWYLPTATTANSAYEIEMADNEDFQGAKTFTSSESNMKINGLESGKKYFWKVRAIDGNGNRSFNSGIGEFEVSKSITAIEENESIPTTFQMSQNYPNPFNPTTTIEVSVSMAGKYSLKIYNAIGQEVASLLDGELSAGIHKMNFNASNLSSGIYMYRLIGNNVNLVRKMILMK